MLACLLATTSAYAGDSDDTAFTRQLTPVIVEEIVVVGARTPRPMSAVAGRVDIITRDHLLNELATSFSDITRYTPGVSVVTADSRFGATELTIRGLSGNRVAMLIDGVPVPDQFDIGAFANAGQDFLSADSISRVEILRGPASTLFGNDALGGVFAVVTRDAEEFITSGNTHFGGSVTYNGLDDATIASVSSAFQKDTGAHSTSAVLHVSTSNGNEADLSASSDPDKQDRDRRSAFAKLGHVLPSGNRLRLEAAWFDEDLDTDVVSVLGYGRQFRNTTSLNGDDSRQRHTVIGGYQFYSDSGWLEEGRINTYWQSADVNQNTVEYRSALTPPVRNERQFSYDIDSYGATVDLQSTFTVSGIEHLFSWGGAVERTDIEEKRNGLTTDLVTGTSSNVLLGESFPVRDFPKSTADEYSIYLQDEISAGAFRIIPGLRYQKFHLDAQADSVYLSGNPDTQITDSDESSFAPKLGLIWNVAPTTQLYAQYAHGFRAPPFEDVNIGLDIPMFNIRAIPNPDLRSETSDGIELGIRLRGASSRVDLTAFGVNYDDLIESKVNLGPDSETGTLLFQSRNIDKARVYGLEASFSTSLNAWVSGLALDAQASWVRGDNRSDNEPLNSVDPAELVTTLSWQPTSALRLALITTAMARKDRIDDSTFDHFETDSFVVFDLTGSYQLSNSTRLDMGIFNALDKTYWRWASVRNRPDGDPMINNLSAPARYATVSIRVDL